MYNNCVKGIGNRITEEKMDEILSEYSVFRKLFDMQMYNKEYFGNAEILLKGKGKDMDEPSQPGDDHNVLVKMYDIRRFVLSLGSGTEKLFIFDHYIHGESVGRVAELMGISRRSAFRIKRRALRYAALRYPIYREKYKDGVTE